MLKAELNEVEINGVTPPKYELSLRLILASATLTILSLIRPPLAPEQANALLLAVLAITLFGWPGGDKP